MENEKFPQGIRIYKPNAKAPSFVKGNLSINRDELIAWLKNQPEKVNLGIKESKKEAGNWYMEIDTFVPKTQSFVANTNHYTNEGGIDNLPFLLTNY